MSDNFPLRCGRLDPHPEHVWSVPRDPWRQPIRWCCNGFVITSLAEREWADAADFDEAQTEQLLTWGREGWA